MWGIPSAPVTCDATPVAFGSCRAAFRVHICVRGSARSSDVCMCGGEGVAERASERVRMSFLFEFVFIGEHSSYSYINIYISRYIPAYSIYTIQLLPAAPEWV